MLVEKGFFEPVAKKYNFIHVVASMTKQIRRLRLSLQAVTALIVRINLMR
jgi:hypothetical protein